MFVLSECHFTIRQTAKNLFALLVCPFHPPVGLKQDRGGASLWLHLCLYRHKIVTAVDTSLQQFKQWFK